MLILFFLLLATPVHAASLIWDSTSDGQLDVEIWDEANSHWTFVKRIPANPPKFPLVTGQFGDYRVSLPDGGPSSNTATYSADIETGLTDQVKALEARVAALESKIAGLCRAAKAMGGTSTSFAGRIRKEVPCL